MRRCSDNRGPKTRGSRKRPAIQSTYSSPFHSFPQVTFSAGVLEMRPCWPYAIPSSVQGDPALETSARGQPSRQYEGAQPFQALGLVQRWRGGTGPGMPGETAARVAKIQDVQASVREHGELQAAACVNVENANRPAPAICQDRGTDAGQLVHITHAPLHIGAGPLASKKIRHGSFGANGQQPTDHQVASRAHRRSRTYFAVSLARCCGVSTARRVFLQFRDHGSQLFILLLLR